MTAEGTGRATRLPREQRRQQVLAAALEAFAASGYHAASMDEIADLAGVSKPVLYQHFPGKLDLYLALLDAAVDHLLENARTALSGTHDNRERVRAMVDAYLDFVEDPSGAFRLLFESDLGNEPAVRQRVDAASEQLTRMGAAVIATDTGLSDAQAQLLASGLHGMVQFASVHWVRQAGHATPISRAEAADLLASLAWRGIGGFPLTPPPQDGSPHA